MIIIIAFDSLQALPRHLAVFAEVFQTDFSTPEMDGRMAKVVVAVGDERLGYVGVSSLSEKQRRRLDIIVKDYDYDYDYHYYYCYYYDLFYDYYYDEYYYYYDHYYYYYYIYIYIYIYIYVYMYIYIYIYIVSCIIVIISISSSICICISIIFLSRLDIIRAHGGKS